MEVKSWCLPPPSEPGVLARGKMPQCLDVLTQIKARLPGL